MNPTSTGDGAHGSFDLVPDSFSTDGGDVRWGAWGDGPPVVLVHGSPFSAVEWSEVLPGLVGTHRVYVWDLLGFGRSAKRDGQDVSLAQQARIFARLLAHWGLESPSVVAHDVGGLVSLRALLVEGARFGDLTLVDAVGVPGWSHGAFIEAVKNHPDVFGALPSFAHRALVASKIADASHRGLRPGLLDAFVEPWTGPDGQAAFYRQYAAEQTEASTEEIRDRLAGLTLPVRILWGRQDSWLAEDYAERMRAAIPHREFAWLDDAGHLAAQDAPGAVVAHLLRPLR